MKTVAIVLPVLIALTAPCPGQTSVNPSWLERNGLTVSSTQSVRVPAERIRFFTTFESSASDPSGALGAVKDDTVAARDVLESLGIDADSVKLTTPKILEWEQSNRDWTFKGGAECLVFDGSSSEFSAISHLCFDLTLQNVESQDIVMAPHKFVKKLRAHTAYESRPIRALYIGDINEQLTVDARKRAYAEANAEAQNHLSIPGASLGKLVAVSQYSSGFNWSVPRYGYVYRTGTNTARDPLASFYPSTNEIFGTDPFELSREITIELRFSIE